MKLLADLVEGKTVTVEISQSTIDGYATKAEKNFNGLTPGQTERLVILSEELAESIQAVAKIMRHGYQSTNHGRLALTNKQHLQEELGHVQNAITWLTLACDLNQEAIDKHESEKAATIKQYLHHN